MSTVAVSGAATRYKSSRALVIAQLPEQGWKLQPGGKCVRFDSTYANRDRLWTGNLTVEGLTPDQVAERPTLYDA
ncbi:hypothetical protein ACWD0G_14910 [Streptomyces goshikiensis]